MKLAALSNFQYQIKNYVFLGKFHGLKLNTLNCDVFKKSKEISFQGSTINSVLYSVIKKDEAKNAKYEAIKEKFSLLSDEEIIGCLTYCLTNDEIQRMIEIKSNNPQLLPQECIVAAKFKLDDNQVGNFITSKNKELNYINKDGKTVSGSLTLDECALCCAYDFDLPQQTRFFELSNILFETQKTARKKQAKGGYLPHSYIISCVKENKTDFQIKQEIITSSLILEDYDLKAISEVASLDEEQLDKYIFFLKEQDFPHDKAFIYAKLNEEQRRVYDENIGRLSVNNALTYSKLDEVRRKAYDENIRRLGENHALDYAKLNEEQRKVYDNNIGRLSAFIALAYARLNEEQRIVYNENIERLGKNLALDYARLNEEQRIVYDENIGKLGVFSALDYAKLDEVQRRVYDENIGRLGEIGALEYAKLNEEQRIVYDENIERFGAFIALAYARLNEEQRIVYDGNIGRLSVNDALAYSKLDEVQRKKADIFIKKGYATDKAIELAKLTQEQYETFKKIPLKLSLEEIKSASRFLDVRKLNYGMLEKMPKNFWYSINANCDEKTQEIIKGAMELVLNNQELPNLKKLPDAKLKNKQTKTLYPTSNVSYNSKNGQLTFKDSQNNGQNDFEINIKEIKVKDVINDTLDKVSSALVITAQNGKKYIAYDGAIIPECHINSNSKNEFRPWGNLLGEIQADILAQAASEFVFDLFAEDGKTIIGTGIEKLGIKPYSIKNKTNNEIKAHYKNAFKTLKSNNMLSAENILRIMPIDCSISINPCNTEDDGNILWGIATSWRDITGKTTWQLRIHSSDLKYPQPDGKWITRLEFINQNEHNCLTDNFEFDNNNFTSANSHLIINSPIKDELLNNTDFQSIIRQISANKAGRRYYNHNDLISLKIEDYAFCKNLVDESRQMIGMIDLSEEFKKE